MKEGSPRNLFYIRVKWQILAKTNTKVPHCSTRSQRCAIQSNYVAGQLLREVLKDNIRSLQDQQADVGPWNKRHTVQRCFLYKNGFPVRNISKREPKQFLLQMKQPLALYVYFYALICAPIYSTYEHSSGGSMLSFYQCLYQRKHEPLDFPPQVRGMPLLWSVAFKLNWLPKYVVSGSWIHSFPP